MYLDNNDVDPGVPAEVTDNKSMAEKGVAKKAEKITSIQLKSCTRSKKSSDHPEYSIYQLQGLISWKWISVTFGGFYITPANIGMHQVARKVASNQVIGVVEAWESLCDANYNYNPLIFMILETISFLLFMMNVCSRFSNLLQSTLSNISQTNMFLHAFS